MRIGVLGAGQLGRMLALAGIPMGLRFCFFSEAPSSAIADLGAHFIGKMSEIPKAGDGHLPSNFGSDFDAKLNLFLEQVDVITYESENTPVSLVQLIEQRKPVHPNSKALCAAQHRLNEKSLFRQLKIPTPLFYPVHNHADLLHAIEELHYPLVLKTTTQGYDGKGQAVVKRESEVAFVWEKLKNQVPLIAEQWIPFVRELSIIGVRGQQGETQFYPITENKHHNGILHYSMAPAVSVNSLQALAEDYMKRLFDALDYVGVLALELFETPHGLLANEMAPRVHNSGHWTQNGAEVCQFQNHLRAMLGWPLGSTQTSHYAGMINLLGKSVSASHVLARGGFLHWYNKEIKPGRKVGHVNWVRSRREDLEEVIRNLHRTLYPTDCFSYS